ncbi:MAG: hypothetical protein GY817_01535 [bacterium]|nr:hypothetical protein [bacterium]
MSIAFSKVIGQERAVTILGNIIKHKKIAHSYIFTGSNSSGKTLAALEFAKLLNCDAAGCDQCLSCKKINRFNHPEVKLYTREKANISIDLIRDIQRSLQFTNTEAKYRVFIIEDAERMTKEANNCFLKTLEEPPAFTVIILLTSSFTGLLKTIISRCQVVTFQPLSYQSKFKIIKNNPASVDYANDQIKNAIITAGQSLKDAFSFLANSENNLNDNFMKVYEHFLNNDTTSNMQREFEKLAKEKENFSAFLTFFLNKVKLDDLKIPENKKRIENILKARKYFERNVNPRLIWAWLYLHF